LLIPSIDVMGGRIVQLVQGEKLALAFDDFEYWIERFASYKLVQLIDLGAAMRQGDNRELIAMISKRLPCQVGGGVRDAATAHSILNDGARRVIIGSSLFRSPSHNAPTPSDFVAVDFARDLADAIGRDHLVFGIDTKAGHVAIKGWKEQVAIRPHDAIPLLEPYCAAFLYTHVDTEGTMTGFPIDRARELRALTTRQLIVAGGIREMDEVAALDALGIDAVSGMAIYTGHIST
jgi:phosphoribosylformimino-5-aminoimidazole carboxamide ribotide isomerase